MDKSDLRKRIIGLGEQSFKKSYYPELQKRISELNLFKSVVDQVSDMVIVINPINGEIEYINDSGKQFFELNNTVKITIEELFEAAFWVQIKEAFKNREKINKAYKFSSEYYVNEKTRFIENSVNLIESSGTHFGVLVIRDITESILAEKELLKAKVQAEESNKLKSAFLANMSHEIRTPMNGILGFVNLLEENNLNEDSRSRYMEIIKASCDDLLRIIDDILDISKLESSSVSLFKRTIDFNEMLDELNEIYKQKILALQKPLQFITSKSADNANIFTDGVRLKQILRNLIDNAIKFSQEGEISVIYRLSAQKLTVSVKDTGIGIKPEKQKLIFERFRQSEENISRTYGGAGLGLSICKGLIGLMKGSIKVESVYGKGSTFTFQIPTNNN